MSVRVENRGRPKDSGKREAILSAAVELFMSHGFAGTSMDNLAAAAQVSKATLYSHFADKNALYRAIIEGKVKDYRLQDFSARLSGDMACDLVVIACDMQDLVFDDDAIRMMRMVVAETQQQSPIVKLFDEAGPHQVFSSIADYFAGCKARGEKNLRCPKQEAETFASLVIGHRRYISSLMGVEKVPSPAARKQHARQAVSAFLNLRR